MERREIDPIILFIASENRSGSTMLDLALGSNNACLSVGEMRQLQAFTLQDYSKVGYRDTDYPLTCTCGQTIDECEFWSRVQERSGLTFRSVPFKSEASAFWRRLVQANYLLFGPSGVALVSRLFREVRRELQISHNCFRVYSAVSALTGARYIIDSSKRPYHYMILRSVRPDRLKLISLYRDGRAVAYSQTRGKRAQRWPERKDSPFAQAVRHWVRTNRAIQLAAWRTPDCDKIAIRYEDICADPQTELTRIFTHFGIPFSGISTCIDITGRHNIGGSPGRFERPRSVIQLDEQWKTHLTPKDLLDFEKLGGRLNRRLGYR